MDQDKGPLREKALRTAMDEINTITPYAIFRISGNPGAYYLEIISIVYPE
ncbi:MAG: hypothetical protein ISS17_00490 [Bacteroidales bacterium]|nr:hypothetical protein [Deltaproteobacteria bacterium]MBL7137237.1 hypothetical protein [Bacteroidales bacterium]